MTDIMLFGALFGTTILLILAVIALTLVIRSILIDIEDALDD